MIKSDTPANIDELTLRDIAGLAVTEGDLPPAEERVLLVNKIVKILGFKLNSDALLMLASEPLYKLGISTAGSGKTTSANIQVILEKNFRKSRRDSSKMISGDKVLCLVYNKHNVQDFIDRHKYLVSLLRSNCSNQINIDDNVQCSTMHAFCDMIRREYKVECNMINYKLILESEIVQIFTNAIAVVSKGQKLKISAQDAYTLYTFYKESLLTEDQFRESDRLSVSGVSPDAIFKVFQVYENIKARRKFYDFTDMLTKIYHLLMDNPQILKEVQLYYEYVIADEVQDFTPLMINILKLLVNNGTPLMCVGDDDQSIYGFRGADILNTLDFKNIFDGGKVYLMCRNRRCGSNIVDVAKRVISKNNLRFDKEIKSVLPGGNVVYDSYATTEGQAYKILQQLKDYTYEELINTVVAVRNKEESIILTQLLADNQIPFHVISGYHAYTHELYRHLMDALYILQRPYDLYAQLNLYKILPIKKEEIASILGYDYKKGRFSDFSERNHFVKIDYGKFLNYKNFKEILAVLNSISVSMDTTTMDTYVPFLFSIMKKYFWNLKRSFNDNVTIDDFFEKEVMKLFCVKKTFVEFCKEFTNMKEQCKRDQRNSLGLNVSTFHALKGLEFRNVIIAYLDDDIFPNSSMIASDRYNKREQETLLESERRLFYVAITRAKENLFFYYRENNPTIFLREFLDDTKKEPCHVEESDGLEISIGKHDDYGEEVAMEDEDDNYMSFLDDVKAEKLVNDFLDNDDELMDIIDENKPKEKADKENLADIGNIVNKSSSEELGNFSGKRAVGFLDHFLAQY